MERVQQIALKLTRNRVFNRVVDGKGSKSGSSSDDLGEVKFKRIPFSVGYRLPNCVISMQLIRNVSILTESDNVKRKNTFKCYPRDFYIDIQWQI